MLVGAFSSLLLLQDRNETIVENQTPVTPANTEYLGQNETRVQDLVKMEGPSLRLQQKNGAYPSVEQAKELPLSTF